MKFLSYNVHMFNNGMPPEENIRQIVAFLKSQNPDIIILQEVNRQYFTLLISLLNYVDYHYAENGAPIGFPQNSLVAIFTAKKIKHKYIIDVTESFHVRKIPIIDYDGIMIAGIHLEIGQTYKNGTYLHDRNGNPADIAEMRAGNSKMRQKQLRRLIFNTILCGDFNFRENSHENDLLRRCNFARQSDDSPTTPYGTRVDHIYYKSATLIDSRTINIHLSDHLPFYAILAMDKKIAHQS